jgi:hypothetical protein
MIEKTGLGLTSTVVVNGPAVKQPFAETSKL